MGFRLVLPDDFDDRMQRIGDAYVTEDVLPNIQKKAKRVVPVDTGELKSEINPYSVNKEHGVAANTEYAAFVELGTSKMAAQPYLRPALTSPLPKAKKKRYKN